MKIKMSLFKCSCQSMKAGASILAGPAKVTAVWDKKTHPHPIGTALYTGQLPP